MDEEPGDLLKHVVDDLRTIARDEAELFRVEAKHSLKVALAEASVIVLGAMIALIGFTMLCVAAVVALAPLIPSLAIRLVLMAVFYGGLGSVVSFVFLKKIRHDAAPDLKLPVYEAKATLKDAAEVIKDKGRHAHA